MTTPASPPAVTPPATPVVAAPATALTAPDTSAAPAAAGAPPAPGTPAAVPAVAEPIEIELPDGFEGSPLFDEFKAAATTHKLKGEQAQAIADLYIKSEQARQEQHEKQLAAWSDSLKVDKEYGGSDFEANGILARKAMTKFASPELREFLDRSGIGNHPEMVRLMYRVGKALGEDSVAGIQGGAAQADTSTPEARLQARYPSMFTKE